MKNINKCINCNVVLNKSSVIHKGTKLEAFQCPKCKQKLFTEEQTLSAINKIEGKRLKKEYNKRLIKIGHSIGLTFPKDIANVLGLDKNKVLKIHPDIKRSKIEIFVN